MARNRFDLTRLRTRARALSTAQQVAPPSGDVHELVDNVARRLGRTITLVPAPLPPEAPSGFWVATREVDYLVYPDQTTLTRARAVICHELGHMLLGHNPALHTADTTDLLTAIAPDLDPTRASRVLARHGYHDAQETDAEYVGTHMAAAIATRQDDATEWEPGSFSDRLR